MTKTLTLAAFLLALAPTTAQEFERTYSLENQSIDITNASLLADGGYAFAAVSYMTSYFTITRTDPMGVPMWSKYITTQPFISVQSVSAIGQFTNGDLYVLVNGYDQTLDYRGLVRLSLEGTVLWAKKLQFNNANDPDYSYRAAKVIEQPSGDILVSIPATMDPVLAKLSSTGAPIWAKSITSTEDTLYDKHPTFDCEPTDDGGCVLCGKDRDWPFVMQVDANGNIVWNQTYYQVDLYSHLRNMEVLPNGDLLFAGMHDISAMMMRMSPSGTILWMKHYPAEYYFESMRSLGDGTFLLVNQGYGTMLHVNADGDVLSHFKANSSMTPSLFSVSGANGMAHVAGGVYDGVNWTSSAYIARFAPDSPPGCMYTEATTAVVDVPSVANTSGTTTMVQQTEPMVVSELAVSLVALTLTDGALCGIAAGVEERPSSDVTFFPSVVSNGQPLNVDLGTFENAKFQWVAANGALAREQNLGASKGTLSTTGLAPGLYTLLTMNNGSRVHTARIVVE